MKILLDENIDVRFKNYFPDVHKVYTAKDMRWTGIKNGELLLLLSKHNFDCWIVVDKNIPYQQNISRLPCLIVVRDVYRNTLKHLCSLLAQLIKVLQEENHSEKIIVIKES